MEVFNMMYMKKKCAVIGIGNMGRHHVRVLEELNFEVIKCDINKCDN
jgi:phosphoglycerate dehydrogenase-like enzyme